MKRYRYVGNRSDLRLGFKCVPKESVFRRQEILKSDGDTVLVDVRDDKSCECVMGSSLVRVSKKKKSLET